MAFAEIQFYCARAIGHLIFAGIFEHHPSLLFVTTEIAGASGIATELARLDMVAKLGDTGTASHSTNT